MIKAMGKDKVTGRVTYLFGLSEENVKRLKQGNPIAFDLEPLGGTGSVLIMYGKTEEHIESEIKAACSGGMS